MQAIDASANRRVGRMRRILVRASLALVSLALGLVLANAAVARWFNLHPARYRADPVLLYALLPNVSNAKPVSTSEGRRLVVSRVDSRGFRGPEIVEPKRAPRIVVYGDSFVFAEDVELPETFVVRLGAELGGSVPPETINAGVVGYGPDQCCLRLEREIDPLAPDLVVLVLCASNDFGDLVRNKIFSVDSDGNARLNRYELEPALVEEFEEKQRSDVDCALLRAWKQWRSARRQASLAGQPVIEWYLAQGQDEYAEYVLEGNLRVRQVWEDYYDADLAIEPERPSSVYKRRLMEAVLARFAAVCAEHEVPLACVIVPSAVDVCTTADVRVDPARYPGWSSARLSRTLEEILERQRVPRVDLYEPFRAAGADGLYFGRDNMHWNAAGQALAARLAAECVRANRAWPPVRVRAEKPAGAIDRR